jgi:hypothetical protein
MRKIRISRTAAAATLEKKKTKEWPIVVCVWAFGLALVSYVLARVVLNAYPHPYHWGTGIAGALFGVGIGWLWYRWRGDIL